MGTLAHNKRVPTRVFLPTDRPLLPQLVDRLLPEQGEGPLRMDDIWIITPTRQSGRRLREALTVAWRVRGGTALLGLQVSPPSVVFQQDLPGNVAHEFDSTAAWSEILQGRDPSTLPALLPESTEPLNATLASSYGRRLQRLREELFDGGLDLTKVARSPTLTVDKARWQEISELEREYRERLTSWGLVDFVDAKQQSLQTFTPPQHVKVIFLLLFV